MSFIGKVQGVRGDETQRVFRRKKVTEKKKEEKKEEMREISPVQKKKEGGFSPRTITKVQPTQKGENPWNRPWEDNEGKRRRQEKK